MGERTVGSTPTKPDRTLEGLSIWKPWGIPPLPSPGGKGKKSGGLSPRDNQRDRGFPVERGKENDRLTAPESLSVGPVLRWA
jgi:hypothetical protein